MKKIFIFILWSLFFSIVSVILMKLLGVFSKSDIYLLLLFLLLGPMFMCYMVVVAIFYKNINIESKKFDLFFTNKSVINTSIFMFIFCILIFIYCIGNFASQFLISHYIDTNQHDKVITTSKFLHKIYPDDCTYYATMAGDNFSKQNYVKSMYYEQENLKCNPNDYLSYARIATALCFLNKNMTIEYYDDALYKLNKGLKINNDSFISHFTKQTIHFKMKDCENGMKDVENILNIIDKKGAEKYMFKVNKLNIEESLPDNWREEVLENLSTCPNSKEKEKLIKKLEIKTK